MNTILKSVLIVYFAFAAFPSFAGEGMWLPQLLKVLNEKEMKSMGMKISAEDIYSINKGSLKDAIVRIQKRLGGLETKTAIAAPNRPAMHWNRLASRWASGDTRA